MLQCQLSWTPGKAHQELWSAPSDTAPPGLEHGPIGRCWVRKHTERVSCYHVSWPRGGNISHSVASVDSFQNISVSLTHCHSCYDICSDNNPESHQRRSAWHWSLTSWSSPSGHHDHWPGGLLTLISPWPLQIVIIHHCSSVWDRMWQHCINISTVNCESSVLDCCGSSCDLCTDWSYDSFKPHNKTSFYLQVAEVLPWKQCPIPALRYSSGGSSHCRGINRWQGTLSRSKSFLFLDVFLVMTLKLSWRNSRIHWAETDLDWILLFRSLRCWTQFSASSKCSEFITASHCHNWVAEWGLNIPKTLNATIIVFHCCHFTSKLSPLSLDSNHSQM